MVGNYVIINSSKKMSHKLFSEWQGLTHNMEANAASIFKVEVFKQPQSWLNHAQPLTLHIALDGGGRPMGFT